MKKFSRQLRRVTARPGRAIAPAREVVRLAQARSCVGCESICDGGARRTDGVGGEAVAEQIATARGDTMLELLIKARGIQMPQWNPNDPAAIEAWKEISGEFAAGVSGEVRAVVGKSLRPGNVWQNVELPALRESCGVEGYDHRSAHP